MNYTEPGDSGLRTRSSAFSTLASARCSLLKEVLPGGDALIIVPPLSRFEAPSLGVHILQACAKHAGFQVDVLYGNLLLAAHVGDEAYQELCDMPRNWLIGERIFAAPAYGTPLLGRDGGSGLAFASSRRPGQPDLTTLLQIAASLPAWLEAIVRSLLVRKYRIVGSTSMFQQTAAAIAFLTLFRKHDPEIVTIMGGANCEGELSLGLSNLTSQVDYFFSGESETAFIDLLQRKSSSATLPEGRCIHGRPFERMDELPTPDYADYYRQFQAFLPEVYSVRQMSIKLAFETSRGCWWGEKHHCTFCGLNENHIGSRVKTPARVLEELGKLIVAHPSNYVVMEDYILPHTYYETLLPQMSRQPPPLSIFYNIKANVSLERASLLKQAGIDRIQAGIESLSTNMLRLMDKGTTASQNLALLRYARIMGISVIWNLLCYLPGDRREDYLAMLELLPLLHHLQPPVIGISRLSIDRFSPYFDNPGRYGITNVRPKPGYVGLLPDGAEVNKIAYHFDADYETAAWQEPELILRLECEIEKWDRDWRRSDSLPSLSVIRNGRSEFLLIDTRGLPGTESRVPLSRDDVSQVLVKQPKIEKPTAIQSWALENRILVDLDNAWVPLALANYSLLREIEGENRRRYDQLRVIESDFTIVQPQ